MQTQEEVMMMIKGKRSKRRYNPSTTTSSSNTTDLVLTSDVVSGTTSDHDQEEQDMANCLILLAKGRGDHHHKPASDHQNEIISFQCKTCNKSFPSFQALGGHRASHKNKPPIATIIRDTSPKQIQDDDDDSTILSLQITSRVSSEKKASRVHECSICGAEFNSGQALGGHMRRHRAVQPPENKKRRNDLLSLDLNLPAPSEDHHDLLESKFPFGPTKEQVIVFSSTSSLVDCHY